MKRMLEHLLVIFLLLSISGCSTIATKIDDPTHFGNAYSGIENNLEHWRCTGVQTLMFFPLIVIVWPVLAADTVASFTADTLILPVDLAKENKRSFGITHCGSNPFQ